MTSFTIDHDIPVPASKDPDDFRFPWAQMKPGDSFVVEGHEARNSARSSFAQYRKRHLNKHNQLLTLVTRSIGNGQYRCWISVTP